MTTEKMNISILLNQCLWKFKEKFIGLDFNNDTSEENFIYLEFDCRVKNNHFVKYPSLGKDVIEYYETESDILNVRIKDQKFIDFYYFQKLAILPSGEKSYNTLDQFNEELRAEVIFSIDTTNHKDLIKIVDFLIRCSDHKNPEKDSNFSLQNNLFFKELKYI